MEKTPEYTSCLPLEQRREAVALSRALWTIIGWENRRSGPALLGVAMAFNILWSLSKKSGAEVGENPTQCFEALEDLCARGEVRLLDDPTDGKFIHEAPEVRQ